MIILFMKVKEEDINLRQARAEDLNFFYRVSTEAMLDVSQILDKNIVYPNHNQTLHTVLTNT